MQALNTKPPIPETGPPVADPPVADPPEAAHSPKVGSGGKRLFLEVPLRVLWRCFLRSYCVGAAWNLRGLQSTGFIYTLVPALEHIHPAEAARMQACRRYLPHYNCHPFWSPLLAGIFLHAERNIADGHLTAQALVRLKDVTANSLSAVGDSFFNGSLLVSWALTSALLLASGHTPAALALGGTLFAGLQLFKFATFIGGLRYGFTVLLWLRRWNLINWGDRIKIVNAMILLSFLFMLGSRQTVVASAQAAQYYHWPFAFALLCSVAWLAGRVHLSRIVLALCILSITVFFSM